MRRKTDRTRQHKDRLQQLCRLSFTIRPMIEATHLRIFWVGRICRYRWLIRPPFPHLGIASLAQVSKTGLCHLPENSLASYRFERLTLAPCSGVYTHTHRQSVRNTLGARLHGCGEPGRLRKSGETNLALSRLMVHTQPLSWQISFESRRSIEDDRGSKQPSIHCQK